MRVGCGALCKGSMVAGCLCLALLPGLAQNTTRKPADTPVTTRSIMVEKGHALEARGRPDLAIQVWQQVLLSDPKNIEALAGLARDLKLIGSDKAIDALDSLRKASPNDPSIAKIQGLASTKAESTQLRQAGELARQGKTQDAMRIYRQLYGDRPPDGDIALAYYQTLYGTPNGKQEAITAMRALAERNPGDPRFAVELGTMLTYEQKTRSDGIRILREHPKDLNAQAALRQALVWESANPASAGELRQYVKEHPQDTELSGHLKEDESKLAQMNSGIARTPAERAAFAALNEKHLDEAEKRFTAILDEEPNNGRAAAGMGFLRMQQNNFPDAVGYLIKAEENGYKERIVEDALATSRFWSVMGEATQAFNQNQFDVASAKYREALVMKPRSPEALNGLAGMLTKQQQYSSAALIYDQLTKAQPNSTDGWRGLFLSYARDNQNQNALAVEARFPATVKTALARDPEYLRSLATIYLADNRNDEAQRVLAQAMALPFPDNGTNLKPDTKLDYAGILMAAKRYDQAVALYAQMLTDDPGNLNVWEGIVSAHHEMGQDTTAIDDVQKMQPAVYESALADPAFLTMLGAIYQQANQYEVAQSLLERAAKLQIAAGNQPSIALQLQLAGIYLVRNDTAHAYDVYQQVLQNNPNRADAWKGLIAALLATNRNGEALQEIALIPAPVRKELDADFEFVQTEASLYAATGDIARATEFMNQVHAHYAKLHIDPPAAVEIQNAWLLLNTHNDRALFPALMRLGSRPGLTVTQRETIQDIWANWSVRRATAAMDNGNFQRAVDLLDAASQAFPDNLTVRKAVAGGYVQVGRAKESLALYKTIPLQDATSADFQGAIGAALAANDKSQTEIWLRQALQRFPRDPAILSEAARFEQARGDNQRAADYYRASLAAMPSASPTEKLAHTLVYPDQDTKAHRAYTAADLQQLLDPNYEPFPKTSKLPPLPAYGADPYNGSAPVVLSPTSPRAQQSPIQQIPSTTAQPDLPWTTPSSTNRGQTPTAPIYVPQSYSRLIRTRAKSLSGSGPRASSVTNAPCPILAIFSYRKGGKPQNYLSAGSIVRRPRTHPRLLHTAWMPPDSRLRPGRLPMRKAVVHATLAAAQQSDTQSAPLSANPPHSQASDAWKGLIVSLIASNHNADAMQELSKIPPDIRQQLEADVEFVEAEASLYVVAGDLPHATESLKRIENFYLLRHTSAPAGMELQHAWLLYNVGDDQGLYPVLKGLDARADLTATQREQAESIWADWAVRKAELLMSNGYQQRGLQILQAASQDYPTNLGVRIAVAGAYAKTGRPADALALYKTIMLQDSTSRDFQGAIAAAIGATDMAQAEKWLRQALALFPNDPQILGLAARFEQARGNTQRAADFWRASLAAMPPGAAEQTLDAGTVPEGSYPTLGPGDMKRLLDPRNDPALKNAVPALPAYGPNNSISHTPYAVSAPSPVLPHQDSQQSKNWIKAPSSNPLPLPPGTNSAYAQTSHANDAPIYTLQSSAQSVNIQSETIAPTPSTVPLSSTTSRTSNQTRAANQVHTGSKAKPASSNLYPYTGKMNVPSSEETVGTTGPVSTSASSQSAHVPPVWKPGTSTGAPNPAPPLRITSQPMGPVAAQAQALFADQTDGQLTQGSAASIHAIANAPVNPLPSLHSPEPASSLYNIAQYTPSAQEAATGAYSAPKQQQQQPQSTPPPANTQPLSTPSSAKPSAAQHTTRKKQAKASANASQQGTPTLGQAQIQNQTQNQEQGSGTLQQNQSQQQPVPPPTDVQAPTPSPTTDTGLSDQELQQRNLPPLRGPWIRIQRQPNPVSPRDEAEMQLHSIEAGYSPWLGGAGIINYRSGSLGYDHLAALEAPFEASFLLGLNTRLSIIAKPVFLDSGQADGNSVITVQESTTAGSALISIPQPIGTLTDTATTIPAQQNAVGIGGEVQLAFPHLAIAGGYTPEGFLVATFTGRAYWKPANGPFTLNFSRDPVRDTQLSYAGLRDPSGNTLGNQGQIWGGVVANQGQVQFAHGDAESGFYLGAGGQYLNGYHVQNNIRIDGSGGAYWRLKTMPEYGNLSIGANFFGMHYQHNEDAFTHGMGGYFSPQSYFLANVPFTWAAHYGTRWHYNILGSLGVQAFQEALTPLWPLAVDQALETALSSPMLPAKTSVGPNYDLRSQVSYQIGPHWFAGGFIGANNSRNYSSVNAGFSIHYMFRTQPSTAAGPTGIFPTEGLRPFTVP